MRARVTRLDFRKDPKFDPSGIVDDKSAHPYIIQTKKHWWNTWKYVMDDETHCPRLFFGWSQVKTFLNVEED